MVSPGFGKANVGYGRKEITEAVARQMNELPYYNTFGTTTTPTTLLAEKITAYAGSRFNHVFTGSGSEANDTCTWAWRAFTGAPSASRRRRS